ncbi:unnamed protein product [Trichogramma brassicae]|uniref:Uncharacterized protein n=1 Tax=Trichogramma brassicae TaxID=86971 RepID=A0A6H5IG12_9HYME|nr:unnamed protein product [Trichogramma brassicae]
MNSVSLLKVFSEDRIPDKSKESHCSCHLSMAISLHVARRFRTPDPSSAIKSRSSRASPRLILYLVRLMRHCKSHGGEPAKTCIATVGNVWQTLMHALRTTL